MIPVADALAYIEEYMAGSSAHVCAFWYHISGDRHTVAQTLMNTGVRCGVVPLLPARGFDNANALSSDLVDLLSTQEAMLANDMDQYAIDKKPIAIVLVSRTALTQPMIASPVEFPDWFPYVGGMIYSLDLIDIGASAYSTVKSQAALIEDLSVLLYECEGLMLAKLEQGVASRSAPANAFLDTLLKGTPSAAEFLVRARERHAQAQPAGFRAVASLKSDELVGRLVGVAGTCSPEQLPTLGRLLCDGLGLTAANLTSVHEPFLTLALRSTQRALETDAAARQARNAVAVMYVASQLITAFAHAAEYGKYNVYAMQGLLKDIREGLSTLKLSLG